MDYSSYLILFAALINTIGALGYVRETLAGRTKPNRVTWVMWTLGPMIAAIASFVNGVTWAALPVFMAGFGPLLILLSTFVNKNAYWKLGAFDYFCGGCSVLALVLWGMTNEPVVAIIFAILSDAFASVPTLVKTWNYPRTESAWVYSTGLFNALTSFTAIKMQSFSEYAFPAYLLLNCSTLLFLIYRKNIFRT